MEGPEGHPSAVLGPNSPTALQPWLRTVCSQQPQLPLPDSHSLFPPAFCCLETKPLTFRSTQPRAGFALMLRAGWSSCQQHANPPPLLLFQYRTVLVPVVKSPGFPKIPGKPVNFIYFAPDDKNPEIHRPVFLELTPSPEMTYRTLAGTSNEMNVLGIVIFSATIGTNSSTGPRAAQGGHC